MCVGISLPASTRATGKAPRETGALLAARRTTRKNKAPPPPLVARWGRENVSAAARRAHALPRRWAGGVGGRYHRYLLDQLLSFAYYNQLVETAMHVELPTSKHGAKVHHL